MNTKTKFIHIDYAWVRVKNACRTTVNKEHTYKQPTTEFKTKLLISEHSPIRLFNISWIWEDIFSWVATQWSRHKFEKFITTQRSDRTGVDRAGLSQEELVDFEGNANIQNLIDAFRKRLCYQSSKETRELAENFKFELWHVESEIADVLVPNCVYRGGCPEFENCGYFKKVMKQCEIHNVSTHNIEDRYLVYNNMLYDGYSEFITGK